MTCRRAGHADHAPHLSALQVATDWARLKAAILKDFPSYAKRFVGFDTWLTVLEGLKSDEEFTQGKVAPGTLAKPQVHLG